MKINFNKLLVTAVLFLSLPVYSAEIVKWDDFNNFLKTTKTFTALFSQKTDSNTAQDIIGKITIKSPQKMLWQVENNNGVATQIIIINSPPTSDTSSTPTALIYDMDLRQAIIKPLDVNEIITPADILLGRVALNKNFTLLPPSGNDIIDTGWLIAVPKITSENQNLRSIKIKMQNGKLAALKILDALEREVIINFSDIHVNVEVSDEIFNLDLPDNVDIINETVKHGNR